MSNPEIQDPQECILKESGKCVGWVCMGCKSLHTTAIYACRDEAVRDAARDAALKCCKEWKCEKCGSEAKRFYTKCGNCQEVELVAREEARWQSAPKITIAEYEHPNGMVCDGDQYWTVSEYVEGEVYLRHPRVYFCDPIRGVKIDAGDILENALQDHHEDAYEEIDGKGLQELLDAWCARQTVTSWERGAAGLDPAEVERLIRERAVGDEAEAG